MPDSASNHAASGDHVEIDASLPRGTLHDFNNLLGIIIGNLDLLSSRQEGDAEAREITREALEAALRGAELMKKLIAASRRPSPATWQTLDD